MVEAVHEGYIAGALIGQNQITLQTSTEARLAPGFMVQISVQVYSVQVDWGSILLDIRITVPRQVSVLLVSRK
jgi:hypothetical protein